MKTKNEVKIIRPDYKKIREISKRMDCSVTEADFNTNRPNPYRIDYTSSDIHRYLRYVGGKI